MKRPGNRVGGGRAKGKKQQVEIELPVYQGEDRAKSLIIFVNSCRSCQLVCEMLEILGVPSVSLHAQLDQRRRLASLGKFRSNLVSVLVATDVASRGLDIPLVDLVVNYDVPRLAEDYIHRVGRTARAGRSGRSVTLVTQHDEALVHAVEERTGKQMEELGSVDEDEVVRLLNKSSKAWQAAKLKLVDSGFEEHVMLSKKRKRKQNRQAQRFAEHNSTS
jgi:ATP-dependent RNA helicase DDX49/DBP8